MLKRYLTIEYNYRTVKRPQDAGKMTGRRAAKAATECRSLEPQGGFIPPRIKRRVRSEGTMPERRY